MTMMFQQIYKYFFFKSNAIKYVCDVDQNMHFNQILIGSVLNAITYFRGLCRIFVGFFLLKTVFLMCSLKIVRENL